MRLSRSVHDELVAHALDESPIECCGMVALLDDELAEVHRCDNAAASVTRYEIDGLDQMRTLMMFEELGAIYHSHTVSPAYPSHMDVVSAFYPDVLYLIVGVQDPERPEIRGWWIRDGWVGEEPLEVRG